VGVAGGLAAAGALIALVAATLGAPGPASLSAVAGLALGGLCLVMFGRRWPEPATGLAAIGLAPVIVAALHRGDAAGAVVLGAGILVLSLRRGVLPWALPAGLLALGLVEATRAGAASRTLAVAWMAAAPLALAGLGAATACSLPAAPRALGAALLGAALVAGATRMDAPDGSLADAIRRAEAGLAADPGPSLQMRLAFLAARPTAHDVAERLVAEHGPELPLQAGWRPQGAALAPDMRIAAAAWLEARGRGGEGRRLLSAGRSDARVAWWWRLSRRLEGLEDTEDRPSTPPPSAHRVPGRVELAETLLTNSSRTWTVHSDAPCALRLEASGEAWEGPARIVVGVDAQPPSTWALPAAPEPREFGTLSTGPHRVSLRFANDASGPGGDRNVHLLALDCVAP
jgi:hypothetical protein